MKLFRIAIALLLAFSVGLGPAVAADMLASRAAMGGTGVKVGAAARDHAGHAGGIHDHGALSNVADDCHAMKETRGGSDTPHEGCCGDGKLCAAALCLVKCFQLTAVLAPESTRLAFRIAQAFPVAMSRPAGWSYGPSPPPPRA
ncbi:MAG TPA: hypothetical protein PKD49_14090 [Hyphomicrobium sp.]|nr:hypothetical protein [Hyphomicrobium sp.]